MNIWLPAFDAHYLLKRPNPYFKILVLSLVPKSDEQCPFRPAHRNHNVFGQKLSFRLVAGNAHNALAVQGKTHFALRIISPETSKPMQRRLTCSLNASGQVGLLLEFFHKVQQKQISSYGPDSGRSEVSGSNH